MTLAILSRDAGWARLVFSTIILAAVGALAGFMTIFMVFIPFDRFYFYAGMNYQSRTYVDSPQGTDSVRTGVEISISPQLPENAQGMYSASRTVSLASPLDVGEYSKVLGASLIEGRLSTEGVVVDEATLRGWGLEVGAPVLVHGSGASSPCRTVVTGVSRPFNIVGGAIGQVVVPSSVCAKQTREVFADGGGQWISYNLAGADQTTNMTDAMSAWGDRASYGAVVWVVSIMAAALWVLALWRTAVQLNTSMLASALALVWIGAGPRRLSRNARLIMAVLEVVASLGAVIVAQNVLMLSTRFYAQPALVGSVAVAMLLVALATSWVFYRGWPVSLRATVKKGEL